MEVFTGESRPKALLAFLPSVICSFFFTQNKGTRALNGECVKHTEYLHPSNGEEELDADNYSAALKTPDYLKEMLVRGKL